MSKVYFIESYRPRLGDENHVKIGIADDPQKRLKSLQTGCPESLRLRGYVEMGTVLCRVFGIDFDVVIDSQGGEASRVMRRKAARALEKMLHDKFDRYKYNGEWYKFVEEIEYWISYHATVCYDYGPFGDVEFISKRSVETRQFACNGDEITNAT